MRRGKLILSLTAFQTRSAVAEVWNLSVTHKMVILVLIIFFYNTLDPVVAARTILFMPSGLQAMIIALVFASYLSVANIFNQRVIISPQLTYLRQLPIEPEDLLWSHILNLTILNIFFAGVYLFLLMRATIELDVSWITTGFLFFAGIYGMCLGQVHYAVSSLRGIRGMTLSMGCFLALSWGFWFLFSRTLGFSIPLFIYTSLILVVAFLLVRSAVRKYPYTVSTLRPRFVNWNLLYDRHPFFSMVVINYLALWRRERHEFTIRVILSSLVIAYSLIAIFYNAYGQSDSVTMFVLIGNSVVFLLLSTLVIKSRKHILENNWVRNVLPLSLFDYWFADYLSLFVLSIPIVFIYMMFGGIFFGLGLFETVAIFCLEFFFIALLSATSNLLLRFKISNTPLVFMQIIVTSVFIAVALVALWAFLLIWLLAHAASWLTEMHRYHQKRGEG